MTISLDSQAMLLMCSHLGLGHLHSLDPLKINEWNPLAKKLQAACLRPGDLMGLPSQDMQDRLEIAQDESERYSRLLQRSGSVAIELERLSSLGISFMTRVDDGYPARYKQRLKESAPSVLFYAGEKELLGQEGIAVVGSRNINEIGIKCTEYIGNICGRNGLVVYSGGARGVDVISMGAAIETRGYAVGVLGDSLEKAIRDPVYRPALRKGDLCLVTPYSPNAPFFVGNAMGRNKLIYTLADYAIIVASDFEKGGTWAGASEALKAKWLPVFACVYETMPEGNKKLIGKGALEFPFPFTGDGNAFKNWMVDIAAKAQGISEKRAQEQGQVKSKPGVSQPTLL